MQLINPLRLSKRWCAEDCGRTLSERWSLLIGPHREELEGLLVLTVEATHPDWG